jgi:hypothetical protein
MRRKNEVQLDFQRPFCERAHHTAQLSNLLLIFCPLLFLYTVILPKAFFIFQWLKKLANSKLFDILAFHIPSNSVEKFVFTTAYMWSFLWILNVL